MCVQGLHVTGHILSTWSCTEAGGTGQALGSRQVWASSLWLSPRSRGTSNGWAPVPRVSGGCPQGPWGRRAVAHGNAPLEPNQPGHTCRTTGQDSKG